MASRAERRAALAMPRLITADERLRITTPPEEDPMPTIRFANITLHKSLPRLDAGIGQATQSTTFFQAMAGLSIELDTATGLVRLSKGAVCRYIPREGVEFFGPTLDDAIAEAKARDAETRRRVEANAAAELAAAEAAARPVPESPVAG